MKPRTLFVAVALIATAHYAQGVAVLLSDLRQLTGSATVVARRWDGEFYYPLQTYHSEPASLFSPYEDTLNIRREGFLGGLGVQSSASQSSAITDSLFEASGSSQTILYYPEPPLGWPPPGFWYGASASIFSVEFELPTPHQFHLEGDLSLGLNRFSRGFSAAHLYLQGPSGNVFDYATSNQGIPGIDLTGILPAGNYLLYASAVTDGSVYRGETYEAGNSYSFSFSLHDVPDNGATCLLLGLALVGLRWAASLSRRAITT
jgi:hypothetical protein